MSVPVIDLRASEARVVEQVGAACERIGFFTVTNHGVPAEVVDGVWRAARAFFDRPEAEKMALALGDREGLMANLPQYYPFQEEALAAGLGVKTPGDLKESIGFGERRRAAVAGGAGGTEAGDGALFHGDARTGRRAAPGARRGARAARRRAGPSVPAERWREYLRAINYPEQEDVLPLQMRAGAHRTTAA